MQKLVELLVPQLELVHLQLARFPQLAPEPVVLCRLLRNYPHLQQPIHLHLLKYM